jgi:hypothetical protein
MSAQALPWSARPLRHVYPGRAAHGLTPGCFRSFQPSRLHLPASLGSAGITRLRCYYGGSDSCVVNVRVAYSTWHTSSCRHAGLSPSCVLPSRLSVSNHLVAPIIAFAPSISVAGFPFARVWASPVPRGLASRRGRIEFVILRIARSPPVAPHASSRKTQLPSASGRPVLLGWTHTSLTKNTLEDALGRAPARQRKQATLPPLSSGSCC